MEILAPNKDAAEFKEVVESLLLKIEQHQESLSTSYVRLGQYLGKIDQDKYWIDWGYKNHRDFLAYVENRIGRKKSQLYAYRSAAALLLPFASAEVLEEIGINKAYALQKLVKAGRDLNQIKVEGFQLMEWVKNHRADEVLAQVNEILCVHEGPRGMWYELGGFYATEDERKEMKTAYDLGFKQLELAPDVTEHEERKQVYLAMARECIASWRVE